jgi:hypothetical protein
VFGLEGKKAEKLVWPEKHGAKKTGSKHSHDKANLSADIT